jgi:hypothetical protein
MANSARGDHLPKRLEPGEDALLIHEFVTMPIVLNQVLRDHGVDTAVFEVVLTLGHGVEVVATPPMQVQADMSEEEIAAAGTRLVRRSAGQNRRRSQGITQKPWVTCAWIFPSGEVAQACCHWTTTDDHWCASGAARNPW